MVLPLLPLLAGTALRAGGARLAAGAVAKAAAGEATGGAMAGARAMKFGGSALQTGAIRHHARAAAAAQQPQPQQPQPGRIRGYVNEAMKNPIDTSIGVGLMMNGSGSLTNNANNDFYRVANVKQFGG